MCPLTYLFVQVMPPSSSAGSFTPACSWVFIVPQGFPPADPPRKRHGAYNKRFIPAWQQVFAVLVISLAKVPKK